MLKIYINPQGCSCCDFEKCFKGTLLKMLFTKWSKKPINCADEEPGVYSGRYDFCCDPYFRIATGTTRNLCSTQGTFNLKIKEPKRSEFYSTDQLVWGSPASSPLSTLFYKGEWPTKLWPVPQPLIKASQNRSV